MANRADDQCPERSALASDLANAIKAEYVRKQAYEDAKAKKEDTGQLAEALRAERNAQTAAYRAFHEHIHKHGCKDHSRPKRRLPTGKWKR
jgi:hypothetical protein